MTRLKAALVGISIVVGMPPAFTSVYADEFVNVYSYRQPFLTKPIFDVFTRETGIEVNTVFAKSGLVERLQSEGANSPADLLFTVDIGRLDGAVQAGVTQPVQSEVLKANVPAECRDPDGCGMSLTQSSPNKKNAIKLMEFLSGDLAQRMYAEQNHEYPVNQDITPSGLVQPWGEFDYDPLSLAEIAKHRVTATKLVDKVGYDG